MKNTFSFACALFALTAGVAHAQATARDTGTIQLQGPGAAINAPIDRNDPSIIYCRGPLDLHQQTTGNILALRIEARETRGAAGRNGRQLKPGQCGNYNGKGDSATSWTISVLPAIAAAAPFYQHGYDLAVRCLMSPDHVYVFNEKNASFAKITHCLAYKPLPQRTP